MVTQKGIVASLLVLPKGFILGEAEGGEVTRRGIRELVEAVRGRYLRGSKKVKTRILNEFVANTGLHRKAAIRLLNRRAKPAGKKKSGRPRLYGLEVMAVLKTAWEATDRVCSRRLQPFLPELLGLLMNKEEIVITEEAYLQLCHMSASTIDRILHKWRRTGARHGFSTTKPGSLLKAAIPIRTFGDWDDQRPGFVEADLVAHCGDSSEGFYLTTLSTVDVATGWFEPVAVWGRGQEHVGGAVHKVRQRLPVPMLGLDSDNGSEFINQRLHEYCQQSHITFTRSRAYKKNDSCHVEQKNWAVVRRVIGYHRFSSKQAYVALENVYVMLRLYVNFFQPVLKLVRKTRHGARVRKEYDTAQTPYRRLLRSGTLSQDKERQLASIYSALNPVTLLAHIRQAVEHLWTLAEPNR